MSAKLANLPEGSPRCGSRGRRTPWLGSSHLAKALGDDYDRLEALVGRGVWGGQTVRKPRSRLAGARQTRARVRRAAAVPAAGAARRSDL